MIILQEFFCNFAPSCSLHLIIWSSIKWTTFYFWDKKKRFIDGYGQETNDLQIISSKKDNEKVIYTVKFDGDTDEKYFEKVSFEKLDNKNKYWRIGYKSYDKDAFEYEIFIDSLYKKTIPYKKEPCAEEYD